jgi:chromosome segregation and condensation protein ScpB
MAIAYYQPITRAELSRFFGKEVSRDLIAHLRARDWIGSGPRSPQAGAPYTYVTTKIFWRISATTRCVSCPTWKRIEDAGLLSKDKLLTGEFPLAAGGPNDEKDSEE